VAVPAGEALEFRRSLTCLAAPALEQLAAGLRLVPGLGDAERLALRNGAASALYEAVHAKVSRVLLLELNAARVADQLSADSTAGRWAEFVEASAGPQFWESLAQHYPTLLPRVHALADHRCLAALALAQRLAADRAMLGSMAGAVQGELAEVTFGAGDSHRGGHSVAVLGFADGRVVYKPRSVQVDAILAGLLDAVLTDISPQARIRVPDVVPRGEYGWARHVTHQYCADAEQLRCFYRGIGHWLAVMRLLGGSDLHAENVIACGPVPVVVDCETLFTPQLPAKPSGFGLAFDQGSAMVGVTVLRTGLLPNRGMALGWRGVDSSAAGALPGQQPPAQAPVITEAGSDRARIGFAPGQLRPAASHPSPEPVPAAYWDQVLAGFTELTSTLKTMDRAGALEPLLDQFADCPVRVVLRATETYAELARMLWHPVSLHDQTAAVGRATRVLTAMAEQAWQAPGDPQVIAAEIADLLTGDIPYFATTPRDGRLTGPGDTTWLPGQDLATAALDRWRGSDPSLEQEVMQVALTSAYLNDGWMLSRRRMPASRPARQHLDRRRRALAASLLAQLRDRAIRGEDGTVTWIAPVLQPTGWAVQPLNLDTYAGLGGIALLLAGYLREAAAGRADDVSGLPALLDATIATIATIEDELTRSAAPGIRHRPPPPGAYVGLGSRIWAWLTLHCLGAVGPDALARACALARQLPDAVAASAETELLAGTAGAIIPLLQLAATTSDNQWLDQASTVGDQLIGAACWKGAAAYWPSSRWPEGLGGLSHGVTGIAWSLARLALATREPRFTAIAQAAFAFEDALYDPDAGGWIDLRQTPPQVVTAWCNGAVGVGLAAADLSERGWPVQPGLIARAADTTRRDGLGWSHTLCHGSLGNWELIDIAQATGHTRNSLDRLSLTAQIVTSIEQHGPVTEYDSKTLVPGMLTGTSGIAYQLLRLHPDCDLPSVLTLHDG
jgi:type 2 lantibiotic biosynthesis protein LanM